MYENDHLAAPRRRDEGQGLVEYALIILMVALALTGALAAFSGALAGFFGSVSF